MYTVGVGIFIQYIKEEISNFYKYDNLIIYSVYVISSLIIIKSVNNATILVLIFVFAVNLILKLRLKQIKYVKYSNVMYLRIINVVL